MHKLSTFTYILIFLHWLCSAPFSGQSKKMLPEPFLKDFELISKFHILLCGGQITLSKIDKICPLAIPNWISTISMHTPSLVKNHTGPEMKIWINRLNQTDGQTVGHSDSKLETIILCQYHVAGYKKE